ncbi:hypothetical protein QTP88_006222 [Uroleucon formosanum]
MMLKKILQVVVHFRQRNCMKKNKEKHKKIGNSENQRNNDKKPGKFNHCKKPGHWKRECRIFLKEQKERNKSNSGNALVGVQSKDIEISESKKWYVDSGASDHMTSRREWFSNYESFEVQLPVSIGDGKYIKAIVAIGVRENKMFSMVLRTMPLQQADQANVAVKNLPLLQWHEMLSHQNVQYVQSYLKHMRIPFTETKNKFFCEACIYGKQHREPFTLSNAKTIKPGQLIHSDVCGPMEENSLGGTFKGYKISLTTRPGTTPKFFKHRPVPLTLRIKVEAEIDRLLAINTPILVDHSEWATPVVPILKEDGSVRLCGDFKIIVVSTKYPLPKIEHLYARIAGAKYFSKIDLKDAYQQLVLDESSRALTTINMIKCLFRYTCVPFGLKSSASEFQKAIESITKKVEGVEVFIDDIIVSGRTMSEHNIRLEQLLKALGLAGLRVYGNAEKPVSYASRVLSEAERKYPQIEKEGLAIIYGVQKFYDYLSGQNYVIQQNLSKTLWAEAVNTFVYTINRTVYAHIPKEKRRQWDQKGKKGIFVGYSEKTKGYRICFDGREISLSRDIIFKESTSLSTTTQVKFINEEEEEEVNSEGEAEDEEDNNDDEEKLDEGEQIPIEVDEQTRMTLRDRGKLNKHINYRDALFSACNDPKYEDAMTGYNSDNWKAAMNDEMSSFNKSETWTLVDLPQNKKSINNGWIYKTKYKTNGDVDRYKARLVIKGCAQVHGIDFQETFSPVVKYDSIRVILAIAAVRKLMLRQFDIKTAFLYGNLEEDIYMKQPKGYEDGTQLVCKLQRSLYGLKQAPRCWNKKFKNMLMNFDLKETKADPCIFLSNKNNQLLIFAISVDDGLIAATNNELVDIMVKYLKDNFETKEGELVNFLERFNTEETNVLHIPTDPQHSLDPNLSGSLEAGEVPFRESVGSLLYLS